MVVFLLTIIRFYLGAAVFFSQDDEKNPALNWLHGALHFTLFFAWSTTITDHRQFSIGLNNFLVFMAIVLLYDLVWWLLSSKTTRPKIILWTTVNVATCVFCALILLIGHAANSDVQSREIIAFVPVFLVNLLDFSEMSSDRKWFREAIQKLGGGGSPRA